MNIQIQTAILDALAKGPKTPQEIRDAIGEYEISLSNTMTYLLRTESISRAETSKGRWKYYIGKTAPGWDGYKPYVPGRTLSAKAEPAKYKIPVKRINVAKTYFGDAVPITITMPAAPWEVAA